MSHPSASNPAALPFIELQSVDSTNNYALSLVHAAGLPERQGLIQPGTAIFTHEQVAGKGQRGKAWVAEKNSGIILSVVIKPVSLKVTQQFHLSAAVAAAVRDFFALYAGSDTAIKWPNDLYWQDRKAGGILIESVISAGNWKWAVAGIGININQTSFSPVLVNPVSLKQITGRHFEPVELAKHLHHCIMQKINELTELGFENIYRAYQDHLYKKGQEVKFKKDNRVFSAVIDSVNTQGQLVVKHATEEIYNVGEVEWLIK